MSELYTAMKFEVLLPDGTVQSFSLAEYLAWRDYLGLEERNVEDVIQWLQASDNNLGRLNCWLSVQQFRQTHPRHPAVQAFAELKSA